MWALFQVIRDIYGRTYSGKLSKIGRAFKEKYDSKYLDKIESWREKHGIKPEPSESYRAHSYFHKKGSRSEKNSKYEKSKRQSKRSFKREAADSSSDSRSNSDSDSDTDTVYPSGFSSNDDTSCTFSTDSDSDRSHRSKTSRSSSSSSKSRRHHSSSSNSDDDSDSA